MTLGRSVAGLAVLALFVASAAAQAPAKKPSPWEPLRFFVGSWIGIGNGQPGSSTVEREYSFTLSERFLEVRNKSTYLPQEKNPKGELHEDRGFVSWDRARRLPVMAGAWTQSKPEGWTPRSARSPLRQIWSFDAKG